MDILLSRAFVPYNFHYIIFGNKNGLGIKHSETDYEGQRFDRNNNKV